MNAQNAPSAGDGPTVISTFAGCGGSSLGYQMAGFRELLAVEWDQNAVDTFRLNFPDVPVYHGDIGALSGAECMRLAGIGPGELDVLDGSPPCQGFSTSGKRQFDDPRNSLFKEYARLLRELQPRVFVMENVTGMVKGVMKQAYLTIIQTLRDCGYRARGEVLNAMYYNVPQSRERVIIIGVRNDLGIEPSHPKPQTAPIPIRVAWKGIEDECGPKPKGQLGKLVALMPEGSGNGSGKYSLTAYGKSQFFGVNRLAWDKVSPTLIKTPERLFHPSIVASPSMMQLKRIGSFPDGFKFTSWELAWLRIENSVPPNLMRAIAEHVRKELLTP
jgi:DNA (cytosine-5)-methyltransferase 1